MAEQQQSKQRERVASESPSPRNELVAQLRLLTPQAFTEDRVDFVKLREFLGMKSMTGRNDFRSHGPGGATPS